MLSGVFFSLDKDGKIRPEFTNQYVLTDLFLSAATTPNLKTPIMPSIATLVNPASTLVQVVGSIFRTIMLVVLSHLPGSQQAIKKISVGNTNVIYHDGRALATCESGPPMRVQLPGLETVGWYNGITAEGETNHGEGKSKDKLGKGGPLAWTREWTTAHPKVDPRTGELIMFHSIFSKPFVQYSVIPQTLTSSKTHSHTFMSTSSSQKSERTPLINPSANYQTPNPKRLINANIPGITSPKMMHDFGVSSTHTIILDLPLSLDPMNIMKGKPSVHYDPTVPSRFGIMPRYEPDRARWFETKACCIFHTANTWTTTSMSSSTGQEETIVHLLACRLTSAGIVFVTGDIVPPATQKIIDQDEEEEQCRLYYFQFNLTTGKIEYEFALSAIAFEFPSLPHNMEMAQARYLYGTSAAQERFDVKLAAKIDCLVKIDVLRLIEEGKAKYGSEGGVVPITGCVDQRSILQILEEGRGDDAIKVFRFPPRHFAQECQFVPRAKVAGVEEADEDEGYLLTYVFDESQLGEDGEPDDYGTAEKRAKSALWVIDAKSMEKAVCKIKLPCRVPYGLHGNWFPKEDVDGQRAFDVEQLRRTPFTSDVEEKADKELRNIFGRGWMRMRGWILDKLA